MKHLHRWLLVLSIVLVPLTARSQDVRSAKLTVSVDRPTVTISPLLYGIFFEEINCSGDGGLYGELIRNRSFEESALPDHWKSVGQAVMSVDSSVPLSPKNTHALRITSAGLGRCGAANGGYWGIALRQTAEYTLSFYARCSEDFRGLLAVSLEDSAGRSYAGAKVEGIAKEWKRFQVSLVPGEDAAGARLVFSATEKGTVWLDVVSLFPRETYHGRTNGLRGDLAGMLEAIRPGFVRFPGGCWVEGDSLSLSYRWKRTIGDIQDRWTQYNIWQYFSTNGLGFHEYLQMCEDLAAEPLFVINCGMSHRANVPMEEMGPWVQDALDAIEYANGPVESTWGSLRAKNGHPASFGLKYMEIGNENGGPAYHERYALFYDAIKRAYPEMHLVADVWGGSPKTRPVEIVDEHYYSTPRFFAENSDRYDRYDRKGPKVYVGEYAVTEGCGKGNLRAGLGEAAFMTGLERNSDVVVMASYAPLFANVNYKRWNPDLINFDPRAAYGTPSYYVQKMFSENRGDVVLPLKLELSKEKSGNRSVRRGKIGLGTWETQAEYRDIRVTKGKNVLFTGDFSRGTGGWKIGSGDWKAVDGVLRQGDTEADRRAYAGDAAWSDYTYTLKARKTGGAEGFLIMFLVKDDDNWLWWNIGGWGNTKHALEFCQEGGKSVLGKDVPGAVETGRWYDVRVEVKGASVRCYLDGKLIHDVKVRTPELRPLYAVASRKLNSGDIILKVVNISGSPVRTDMNIQGVSNIQPRADAFVLTSADPADENTIAEPRKVATVAREVDRAGGRFTYTFPANSLTVLRLHIEE